MGVVIGILIGFVLGWAVCHRKPVGRLRVDHSDPSDPPYLFLELSTDVGHILRKKYVVLRVWAENFIPHK